MRLWCTVFICIAGGFLSLSAPHSQTVQALEPAVSQCVSAGNATRSRPAAAASRRSLLEMQILGPRPDLLDQNLHFQLTPRPHVS